jgi:hypothetical protein
LQRNSVLLRELRLIMYTSRERANYITHLKHQSTFFQVYINNQVNLYVKKWHTIDQGKASQIKATYLDACNLCIINDDGCSESAIGKTIYRTCYVRYAEAFVAGSLLVHPSFVRWQHTTQPATLTKVNLTDIFMYLIPGFLAIQSYFF